MFVNFDSYQDFKDPVMQDNFVAKRKSTINYYDSRYTQSHQSLINSTKILHPLKEQRPNVLNGNRDKASLNIMENFKPHAYSN